MCYYLFLWSIVTQRLPEMVAIQQKLLLPLFLLVMGVQYSLQQVCYFCKQPLPESHMQPVPAWHRSNATMAPQQCNYGTAAMPLWQQCHCGTAAMPLWHGSNAMCCGTAAMPLWHGSNATCCGTAAMPRAVAQQQCHCNRSWMKVPNLQYSY